MKLASLRQGRDGHLVVVSRDLQRAVLADDIAATLQDALDRWDDAAPRLEERYRELCDEGPEAGFAFDPGRGRGPAAACLSMARRPAPT